MPNARNGRRRIRKVNSGGLLGSPETIRNHLREYSTLHVDQIILLNQAGKTVMNKFCESLELFAKEVMPAFQAAQPEHQQWKQKVLAGEIELEEIDIAPLQSRFSENSVQLSPAKAAVGDN